MKFVIGLGNPGSEYSNTRHNIGAHVVEKLTEEQAGSFTEKKQFKSQVAKVQNTVFVVPQTFMNLSGEAVQAVLHFYGSDGETGSEFPDLYVVHDDLDIELGSYKIQYGTGPKTHNGLASIYQHLKTDQFWHVRIGVDTRQGDRSIPPQNYVLTKFSEQEQKQVQEVSGQVVNDIKQRLAE